jgi:deferrochelatase/peroxidase EfeB
MRVVHNANLQAALTGGDLLLEIKAQSTDTSMHGPRQIMRATRAWLQRWRLRTPYGPKASPAARGR